MATNVRTSTFTFSPTQRQPFVPYLPASLSKTSTTFPSPPPDHALPFLSLTYATSIDSTLSLTPGVYHPISSPQSMALTHYLRASYSAILIGVGTAVADNPGLNCRLENHPPGAENQPRPVVVDPTARWKINNECQFLKLAREGKGKAPWIVTSLTASQLPRENLEVLEQHGGKYITLPTSPSGRMDWRLIMQSLKSEGLDSILIDGGGKVINDWLSPENKQMLDSVIVTVAPTWLGRGGVVVCPERRMDEQGNAQVAARAWDVRWVGCGEDIVMCGRFKEFV